MITKHELLAILNKKLQHYPEWLRSELKEEILDDFRGMLKN